MDWIYHSLFVAPICYQLLLFVICCSYLLFVAPTYQSPWNSIIINLQFTAQVHPYVLSRLPLLRDPDHTLVKQRAQVLAYLSALLSLKSARPVIQVGYLWVWVCVRAFVCVCVCACVCACMCACVCAVSSRTWYLCNVFAHLCVCSVQGKSSTDSRVYVCSRA